MLTSFVGNMINSQINRLTTAYVADVITVNADGTMATVRPRSAVGAPERAVVSAIVPPDVKIAARKISRMTGATATTTVTETHSATTTINPVYEDMEVYVPVKLEAGDVVYVGVCNTELHDVNDGTERVHDINNSVILRVL